MPSTSIRLHTICQPIRGADFFGQNNNWYSGSNNTTYYLQDSWVAATYTNSYTTLLSSWKKIKQESEKNETPEIFALAQILKISAWHKTLESFGPIPYTHAGEPALVIPFDSEQVAFNAMFTDLTAAIDILTVREGTRGNYCCRL